MTTPQLVYHTALPEGEICPATGEKFNLTLGNSYELVASYDSQERNDVVLVFMDDNSVTHGLYLNDSGVFDHFDMIGDYTEVWEYV